MPASVLSNEHAVLSVVTVSRPEQNWRLFSTGVGSQGLSRSIIIDDVKVTTMVAMTTISVTMTTKLRPSVEA